jgi:hypothetical protein
MGLLGTTTQQSYYQQSQTFTNANGVITGSSGGFRLTTAYFPTLPTTEAQIEVFINGIQINQDNYAFNGSGNYDVIFSSTGINSDVQETSGAPKNGLNVLVREIASTEQYGNYQYIGINNIVNNFIISYVGQDKIIQKVKRADVFFHAQRALAEMSYDTLRSNKSQEIEIPPALTMILPHDYVNYVKISWLDNDGVERLLLPARKTSNPKAILQDSSYDYLFDADGSLLESKDSDTWTQFQSSESNNTSANNISDSEDIDKTFFLGQRYGIAPEYASSNGLFYIDDSRGRIYFSSNLSGMTVKLNYISDTLGLDGEMQIHKFAEEAMYKWIAHAIIATRVNTPEYLVARFKKERFAAVRTAKLRLSNLKSEELAQIMRGKSKQIKH